MSFSDESQPFHTGTTDPGDAFTDNTEAVDNDMHPDELGEGSNSLEDNQYLDDDDYEEIPEDEA